VIFGDGRLLEVYEYWRPCDLPSGEAGEGAEDEPHECEHCGNKRQKWECDCCQYTIPVEPGQGDVPSFTYLDAAHAAGAKVIVIRDVAQHQKRMPALRRAFRWTEHAGGGSRSGPSY
jgi:hypothetical protein